jgi:transmembrane sensor
MARGFASAHAARIAREAAAWHSRMLAPVSAAERAAFDAWHADPAHARAYAEIAHIAALAEQLPAPARRAAKRPMPRPSLRPVLAFGLIGLLLACGLVLTMVRAGDPAQAALTNLGPATRVVRLDDGSTVALDIGTRLSFSVRKEQRAVTVLAGRARFDVAPGRVPFAVTVGAARVTADRARLDISRQGTSAHIALLDGSAHVAPARDVPAIRLAAGEALTLAGSRAQPMPLAANELLWPLARIAFDHAPLARVVDRANAVGGVPIRLDPGLATLPVTGVLDLRDTRRLAPKLAAALDLTLVDRGDVLVLARVENF